MDTNITARVVPLPYPESPSVADWQAETAPQQAAAQVQPAIAEGEQS